MVSHQYFEIRLRRKLAEERLANLSDKMQNWSLKFLPGAVLCTQQTSSNDLLYCISPEGRIGMMGAKGSGSLQLTEPLFVFTHGAVVEFKENIRFNILLTCE